MTNKAIAEAHALFSRTIAGDYSAKAKFVESLTTSDFPALLGQGFNVQLLAAYETLTPVWDQYSRKTTVPNFKPQKFRSILAGAGLKLVPEATEYPASSFLESEYDFRIEKYGDRFPLTFEMVKNDELEAFSNLPNDLATAARDLEGEKTADALLNAKQTDVNTNFFKAANGNAPESAPLTRAALKDAIELLSLKKNAAGKVIARPNLVLVVPPSLQFVAKDVVAESKIRTTAADGSIQETSNPLAGSVKVVVDYNLLRNTHAAASTTWYLLADPSSRRPSVVTGFLAGAEQPEIRVKNDTGVYAGGGSVNPLEGSFDDDTIQYRARHFVGSAAIDPTFAFVSRGA